MCAIPDVGLNSPNTSIAANIIPAVLIDIGIMKKNSTCMCGSSIIVSPSIAIMAPLAPNAGVVENIEYISPANIPALRYIVMNLFVPIFCSINPPNIRSAYMLNSRCAKLPCRNIDVISVHGFVVIIVGFSVRFLVKSLPSIICSRNIITFIPIIST